MTASPDGAKYLRIYLEDHVAGATAGCQRAARLAEAEAGSSDAAALGKLAHAIEADRAALLELMEAMGFEQSRVKSLVASVGERLGTLKPNGHVAERSPLTSVVELEALQMAVRGKRSLWESLRVASPTQTTVDLEELIARADEQLDVLSALHGDRAATTFSTTAPSP
jgi:hypothetical protein